MVEQEENKMSLGGECAVCGLRLWGLGQKEVRKLKCNTTP